MTLGHDSTCALLCEIFNRLEVIAPEMSSDHCATLLGFVGLLEHATLEEVPAHLLAVSSELHGVVETLLYASVRQTIERRCMEVDLARRVERIGAAARWAYLAIVGGLQRGDEQEADRIANVALMELTAGDHVEDSAERLMRELATDKDWPANAGGERRKVKIA